MPKLDDFKITDFSGGLVTDLSDYEMNRNMMKNTRNFEFDYRGRAMSRRGSEQTGQTITSKILDNSVIWGYNELGLATAYSHLVATRETSPTLYKLQFSYLTAAIAAGATSLVVKTDNFAATGVLSVGGDQITYTGKAGTTFTVTGATVTRAHPAYTLVSQLVAVTGTCPNSAGGLYFASLGNKLMLNGYFGSAYYDGSAITAISDDDEPAGVYATTYRQRIYVAGSGAVDGAGTRNGSRIRISYSDAGDMTAWTLANYFDVEEERGEGITGLAELGDNLLIFKTNSLFTYDEVNLKLRMNNVGAYTHRVIQRIGDSIYTFCPSGVFVTNGFSAKKISGPVDAYLRGFRPVYGTNTWSLTLIDNCFAGQFNKKYFLYIGDITEPEVLTDVVLVYDTEMNNWTVLSGWTDITHFCNSFIFGSANAGFQSAEAFFAGDVNGKYWRIFENTHRDIEAVPQLRGGDITADMVSDTKTPISSMLETPFYDLGNPSMRKKIGYLTSLMEQADVQISYRLDMGNNKFSDWISLGHLNSTIVNKKLYENDSCYRIAFRATTSSTDVISKINGFIINDIELIDKVEYAGTK